MKYHVFLTLLPLVAVAACGGGGSSIDGTPSISGLQQMSARGDTLYANEGLTTYAQLPTSGTARYDGYAIVDYDPNGDGTNGLLGNARLDADFATDEVSGRLDNFHRVTSETKLGRAYSGALTVSGGTIGSYSYFGPALFDGRVHGTLDGGNDVVVIDNAINGAFIGDDHDMIEATNDYGNDTMVRNGVTVPVGIAIIGER